MTANAKIAELRQIIANQLNGLIDRDYFLLELPYYNNIGDVLIWQGEEDYLCTLPYACKGRYALETFRFPEIPDDTLILFQGGGNFGDLWAKHHEFKMRVIEHYPRCRFLFFPQTVFFGEKANLLSCTKQLAGHDNITICARDQASYELLTKHFSNRILLVPDMAFYIDNSHLSTAGKQPVRDLLLMRDDRERVDSPALEQILAQPEIAIRDWPSMERRDFYTWLLVKFSPIISSGMLDWYCQQIYQPFLMRCGVQFINTYRTIHSTRLHGAILALLLGKDVVLYDNSYGKNSGFYGTWLADCEQITLAR